MTIRPATILDLDEILPLNTAIFEETNTICDNDLIPTFAQTETGREHFLRALNDKVGCFFVAEDHGKLIGYANGSPCQHAAHRHKKYFEVANVGVIPKYRKQRIGTKLLEAITNWAKDNGFQRIYLNSYIKNTAAINFYKKHGYQEIDISLEKTI